MHPKHLELIYSFVLARTTLNSAILLEKIAFSINLNLLFVESMGVLEKSDKKYRNIRGFLIPHLDPYFIVPTS